MSADWNRRRIGPAVLLVLVLIGVGRMGLRARRTAANGEPAPAPSAETAPTPTPPPPAPTVVGPKDSTPSLVAAPGAVSRPPPHPMALVFGSGSAPPEREPAILLDILDAYRRIQGSYPIAEDNARVMRQLTGRDPRGLPMFPSAHPRFDDDGALLDAWGTPYFFHHLSQHAIEVRSAGPDAEMFTDDDIVAPSPRPPLSPPGGW